MVEPLKEYEDFVYKTFKDLKDYTEENLVEAQKLRDAMREQHISILDINSAYNRAIEMIKEDRQNQEVNYK